MEATSFQIYRHVILYVLLRAIPFEILRGGGMEKKQEFSEFIRAALH